MGKVRDNFTTRGGGSAYAMVRSKIMIDPKTHYGMPVTKAREALMEKLGYNPGYNVVASHLTGGTHFEKDGGAFRIESRGDNTTRSNIERTKKSARQKMMEMQKDKLAK